MPELQLLNKAEVDAIESLAERLNTQIPDLINQTAWPLPIFRKLIERIEQLEERLKLLQEALRRVQDANK